MNDQKDDLPAGADLDFPIQFMEQSDELARRTDDGDAWAEFMYGKWFVCPTARLKETLQISLERRRSYVAHGTDDSDRLDVLVDSATLLEESNSRGFELPHVSLHDLIVRSLDTLMDWSSGRPVLNDADKPDAEKLITDIEAAVASAITELRSFLSGGTK